MSSPLPRPGRRESPDGVSLAALVTGVLALGPVAFALGAVGLHRTAGAGRGGRARGGRALAVAGTALGGLQMAAASVLVLAAVLGAGLGQGANSGWTDVDDLAVGDCFSTGADSGLAGDVRVLDCAQRHSGEVLEVVDLPDGGWPGVDALDRIAVERCAGDAARALGVAGLDPVQFEYDYWYPLEEDWNSGGHLLQCTVWGAEGDLAGSVLDGDARALT